MNPTAVILLVAVLVASSCALVGSFLVLRKMALLGDAISHAVLPGIVVAFLVSGSRSPLPMLLGAGALGVLTVVLVELAHRTRLLKADASIGVVFPALFALGVLLVSRLTGQVDLDLDCVLYGEIAYAPWDVLQIGGTDLGPKALWTNGATLLINLALVVFLFKELKLSTFDSALSAALGFSPAVLHYVLMTAVSVTVVGAFESVGAILVVAMLIVPPATAYLLTDRLEMMLGLAVGFGALSAVLGYAGARWLDASIAGAMATTAGLLFALVFVVSPQHGLLAKRLRRRHVLESVAGRMLLLHLERDTRGTSLDLLGQRFSWRPQRLLKLVQELEHRGWVSRQGTEVRLTAAGERELERSGHMPLRHGG